MARRTVWAALLLLTLGAAGCQTTAKPATHLDRGLQGARMSSAQLDVHMADFVLYHVNSVERAADRIAELSPDDPAVQEAALRWKIYTIPAVFSAAFHDDPLASYLDLRVFTLQMQRFFTSGPGRKLFGAHQQIAVATCDDLVRHIEELGNAISIDPALQQRGRKITESMAAEHPLTDLYFLRPPLDPERIKSYVVEARGVVDVAHDINRNIAAIRRLVAAEFAILPRQAAWQAQLATLEMLRTSGVDPGAARVHAAQLARDLHTLTETAAGMGNLVGSERQKVFEEANALQRRTLEQVQAMLSQTQGWTDGQRRVVMEQLAAEREAILRGVERERAAAVQDIRQTSDRAMKRMEHTADRLIDRLFRRLLLFWAIVLVTGLLAVILIRRLVPKR